MVTESAHIETALTQNIEEWENGMLGCCNSKTLNFDKFYEYVDRKELLNYAIGAGKTIFRKFKFSRFIRTQQVETKITNDIQLNFGPPQDVVICIGDWSQKHHRPFHEPTKGGLA